MQPTEADLARFQECFRDNGMPRDLSLLRWQYRDHPAGRLLVDFAVDPGEDGERIGAIYAVFPVAFKIGDETHLAAQSLDTLTDAAYRGRGLFVKLAEDVYERCRADGVALVYGFPNGNSAHGFFGRLGWTSLDPVPFLFRPLRTRYFLKNVPRVGGALSALPDVALPLPSRPRLAASQRIAPLPDFDGRVDRLWEAFSRGIPVAIQRGSEYLRWRISSKPGEEYHAFGLFEGDALKGLVVYTVKEKHGGRVGYVMELIHDPSLPAASKHLLRHAVRDMGERRADVVLAWSLDHSPSHPAYRDAGFRVLPEALRPIELHFGVRAFQPSLRTLLDDRRNWYVSYCDSDTV